MQLQCLNKRGEITAGATFAMVEAVDPGEEQLKLLLKAWNTLPELQRES